MWFKSQKDLVYRVLRHIESNWARFRQIEQYFCESPLRWLLHCIHAPFYHLLLSFLSGFFGSKWTQLLEFRCFVFLPGSTYPSRPDLEATKKKSHNFNHWCHLFSSKIQKTPRHAKCFCSSPERWSGSAIPILPCFAAQKSVRLYAFTICWCCQSTATVGM